MPGSVGATDPRSRRFRAGTRAGAAEMVHPQVQRGHAAAADQEDGGEDERFQAAKGDGTHGLRAIYHSGGGGGCRRTGPSAGRMNQKVEPRPGSDSAPMVPPCISTSFLLSASPSPVPWAFRLAELST